MLQSVFVIPLILMVYFNFEVKYLKLVEFVLRETSS